MLGLYLLTVLAQTASHPVLTPDEVMWRIIVGGMILMGLIIVGGAALLIVRNKIRQDASDDAAGAGFTLADLRDMYQRGELTEAEFQTARAKLIAKVKGPRADS